MTQDLALNILKSGRNVFLTGQAGSGKTFVINQYIQWLWGCDVQVAITASTGIAATHIGGVTIHSRSGIGINNELTPHDMELIQGKEHLYKNITKAKVLIIDEISMLSANTIDMVDKVVQMLRRDGRPFGGLQVILVGDFFQLPPVMSSNPDGTESTKRFAFAAKARKDLDLVMCYLHTQHRQDDGDFRTILNALRIGEIQTEHLTLLKTRLHQRLDHANPVKLYTHNIDVDRINTERLHELDGDSQSYTAYGVGDPKLVAALTKSMLAPEVLELKVGAQVIFVKNNPAKGYYNGTTGQIISFDTLTKHPWVQVGNGRIIKAEPEIWSIENATEIVASVSQVPLKLAWAITVHKSQGMTLDAAEMDLSRVFEPGQAYVALSRIRSLDGLNLLGINEQGLYAHPLVLRADAYFWKQSEEKMAEYEVFDADAFEQIHRYFVGLVGGKYVVEATLVEKTMAKGLKSGKTKSGKPKGNPVQKGDTLKATLALVKEGLTIEQIAKERGLTSNTIREHLIKIHALHPEVSLKQYKPDDKLLTLVRQTIKKLPQTADNYDNQGRVKLRPIFDALGGKIGFDEIKRCMVFV